MTEVNRYVSKTRRITLGASLAATYFILRSIPTFQMIGISSRFTAGDFVLTSIALIGGFWSGTISVLIGTTLAYSVSPPTFFGLDFLPAVANVSISALVLTGRQKIAAGIYLACLLAFIFSPYSLLFAYSYLPYTWLHIVALVVLLSPLAGKTPAWLKMRDYREVLAIVVLAFTGTMGQHLVGGLLFELVTGYIGGISPSTFQNTIWRAIFFVYPFERTLIVAISVLIALALRRSILRLYA